MLNPGSGTTGLQSLDGYKLSATSPAITSGRLILNNGGKDFFGNLLPVSTTPNRGVYQGVQTTTTVYVCSNQLPYVWQNSSITTEGVYVKHITSATGYDSVATLNFRILQSTYSSSAASACFSYTWNGVTYTNSGTYTWKGTNANGCDSFATLTLTIQNTYRSYNAIACSSYTWHGVTYTNTCNPLYTYSNSYGCPSVDTLHLKIAPCTKPLKVRVFLEGYYHANQLTPTLYGLGVANNPIQSDSIEMVLWSVTNNANLFPTFSQNTILNIDGWATTTLPADCIGRNYYISVRHRNSLETWSGALITITDTTSYDFTNSMSQAFGDGNADPMKNMGNHLFALYSGDVNQDGAIDGFDLQLTENDANDFLYGYYITDCNGDGAVDGFDMQIIENNSQRFLFKAMP